MCVKFADQFFDIAGQALWISLSAKKLNEAFCSNVLFVADGFSKNASSSLKEKRNRFRKISVDRLGDAVQAFLSSRKTKVAESGQ